MKICLILWKKNYNERNNFYYVSRFFAFARIFLSKTARIAITSARHGKKFFHADDIFGRWHYAVAFGRRDDQKIRNKIYYWRLQPFPWREEKFDYFSKFGIAIFWKWPRYARANFSFCVKSTKYWSTFVAYGWENWDYFSREQSYRERRNGMISNNDWHAW